MIEQQIVDSNFIREAFEAWRVNRHNCVEGKHVFQKGKVCITVCTEVSRRHYQADEHVRRLSDPHDNLCFHLLTLDRDIWGDTKEVFRQVSYQIDAAKEYLLEQVVQVVPSVRRLLFEEYFQEERHGGDHDIFRLPGWSVANLDGNNFMAYYGHIQVGVYVLCVRPRDTAAAGEEDCKYYELAQQFSRVFETSETCVVDGNTPIGTFADLVVNHPAFSSGFLPHEFYFRRNGECGKDLMYDGFTHLTVHLITKQVAFVITNLKTIFGSLSLRLKIRHI